MIARVIEREVEERLFKKKVILLYGARQTGKTTLVKGLLKKHDGVYFSGDEPDVRARFAGRTSSELKFRPAPFSSVFSPRFSVFGHPSSLI